MLIPGTDLYLGHIGIPDIIGIEVLDLEQELLLLALHLLFLVRN